MMESTPRVRIASLDVEGAVVSVVGREKLGALSTFEVTFACDTEALELESVVGAPVELLLDGQGGPSIHGVLSELEQGDTEHEEGFVYRAVLVPSLWLMSLGRRSRAFTGLSVPEVIDAVLSSSELGCEVEVKLDARYPRHASLVQHRESDLDFVMRLAQREGITLAAEDEGGRCRVRMSDRNASVETATRSLDAAALGALRCRQRALPRFIELSHHDPRQPELPLRARALVSESGFGTRDVEDVAFTSPEDGERVALIVAERVRGEARQYTASTEQFVRPGQRIAISGHRRSDFNRDLLVVEAAHRRVREGASDAMRTEFSAIPFGVTFRPERTVPEPKIFGLMGGRVAMSVPDSEHASGRVDDHLGAHYRVQSFEGGANERAMPLASLYGGQDQGLDFSLAEGAHVVWGCLDGDPDRPIITAALPDDRPTARRPGASRIRGAGGATIELSGSVGREPGDVNGVLLGQGGYVQAPTVAHHTETGNGDGETTAAGAGGETTAAGGEGGTTAAGGEGEPPSPGTLTQLTQSVDVNDTAPAAVAGEPPPPITYNYTDTWMRFGVPHSGEGAREWTYLRIGEAAINTPLSTTNAGTFNENAETCGDLDLNAYTQAGVAGVFDFTHKNRTTLTKGDEEAVVRGKQRIAVHDGKGDPTYLFEVKDGRVESSSNTTQYDFKQGCFMEGIVGTKIENVFGGKVETMIGGKLGAELGFLGAFTAGYKVDVVLADSLEIRKGEELGSSTTLDKRATEKVQYSIHPDKAYTNWETVVAGVIAAGSIPLLTCNPAKWSAPINAAVYGGAVGASVLLARKFSRERDLKDGDPILSLTKLAGLKKGILRADDWWLSLTPEYAVLGKNQKYDELVECDGFSKDKTTTGLILEEGNKVTLQSDKSGAGAAIRLEGKKLIIEADSIEIRKVGGGDSKLTLTGSLEVSGDVTIKTNLTVNGDADVKGTVHQPALNATGSAVPQSPPSPPSATPAPTQAAAGTVTIHSQRP